MSWLHLDVRSATVVAAVLLVVVVLARRSAHRWSRFVAAAAFEAGLVCALFALWQVANALTRGHTTGGMQRGQSLWHLERVLHLPSEVTVQRAILGHDTVVRAVNYYYDTAHLTLMLVFLVWLWVRHRPRYPFVRNVLVAVTGMSLLVQMVAVAPPRLIGGTGLVDTAMAYGQSVYATFGDIADQYAAMPSIHVAWALLVSAAVITCSTSRWRWIPALHGPVTCFVVVATANHYWLDGVVAAVLLAVAWFGERWRRGWTARRTASSAVELAAVPQIQQGAFSS